MDGLTVNEGNIFALHRRVEEAVVAFCDGVFLSVMNRVGMQGHVMEILQKCDQRTWIMGDVVEK